MSIVLSEQVLSAVEEQRGRVHQWLPDMETRDGARDFLKELHGARGYSLYHHFPTTCLRTLEHVRSTGDTVSLSAFLRYVLAIAIIEAPSYVTRSRLPASVIELYPRHISRIAGEFSKQPDEFYSISCDRFVKDLCILTLRLIPVGGRLISFDSGIPRRLLLQQGGPTRTATALWRILVRAGGFRPYLQSHLHTSDLVDFNPDGMLQTYLRIADLLRGDEHCLGYCTASWFNDPAVAQVSPRLAYLTEVLEAGGAFSLRGVIDENSTGAALARSPTRRRLHDEGKYQPRTYYYVWPRKSMLAWADDRRSRKGDLP